MVPRRFAANEYEVYFQDQWRIHPSLTLNLGLRYTNATPPWETNGNQVIPVPVNPSLNGSFGAWFDCRDEMRLAGRPTADCGLIETQLGERPTTDGRTSTAITTISRRASLPPGRRVSKAAFWVASSATPRRRFAEVILWCTTGWAWRW